jgi:hypothetical protein
MKRAFPYLGPLVYHGHSSTRSPILLACAAFAAATNSFRWRLDIRLLLLLNRLVDDANRFILNLGEGEGAPRQ